MTVVSERDQVGGDEAQKTRADPPRRIEEFRYGGASATSLRSVAAAAGVSLGLVQHHFETKAGLIKAVDDYVHGVVIATIAQPISAPPADSVAEMGAGSPESSSSNPTLSTMSVVHSSTAARWAPRSSTPLSAFGTARWNQREETHGEARPDIDLTWAALNSLVLALGAMILRGHIERQLPEPLTTPSQLQRWQAAVNMLLRDGLFRLRSTSG